MSRSILKPSKIEITELAAAKLRTFKKDDTGTLLVTYSGDGEITILGCVKTDYVAYQIYCPGGVFAAGRFVVSEVDGDVDLDVIPPIVLRIDPKTGEITAYHTDAQSVVARNVEMTVLTEADVAKKFFIARCQAVFPVNCEFNSESIGHTLSNISSKGCKSSGLLFDVAGVSDQPEDKNKKYTSLRDMDVVNVPIYQKFSESADDGGVKAALVDHKKRTVMGCWFDLRIDALALIRRTEKMDNIVANLEGAFENSVSLYRKSYDDQLDNKDSVSDPEVFHFLSDVLFLTVVYPKKRLDRDPYLENFRAKLHSAFYLPTDRPLLMRGNALTFTKDEKTGELINVHESVGPSNVPGGEPVVVQGRYAYHHYCQQGFDDSGWGCAYRSLQTLCSWFKLQGYTNRPVPTIRQIQQCLVDIGDKPASFLGSSQWIGSTEVGFCLDTLLGVSSRFVNVSSGDELSMKGGELSHHFKTQGTPVMIGGGNLAHTILGVDYNKKTGDIKFLILDPHYTGADSLDTIVAKGWCGWKGINFWKKGSFYNMCMPIRPKCI